MGITEAQQIVLIAFAAGAGALLGVAVSIWIDVLVKRSRVLVFGWLEREQPEKARLSIYIKNDSRARVEIKEVGTITRDGKHLPVDGDNADSIRLPRPLPFMLESADVIMACELTVEDNDAIGDFAACYAIRTEGKFIKGPVYQLAR